MAKDNRTAYIEGARLYPVEFAGHHVQGIVAALFLLEGNDRFATVACLWTFGYVIYQGFTAFRKRDAAGLDVLDYVVGLGIGIAAWYALAFTGNLSLFDVFAVQ